MAPAPPTSHSRRREASEGRLLDVARRRFLADGYDAVTLRSIATDADVDPSLAVHHFGSKRELFLRALNHGPAIGYLDAPLDVDRSGLGRELAERVFDDSPTGELNTRFHATVTAGSARPELRHALTHLTQRFVIEPLTAAIGDDPHAVERAHLLGAALSGALSFRAALGDPPGDRDAIIAAYAAALQSIIDAEM